VKPGQRHPSWPWWLRVGMIVWTNHPDSDEPWGRIVGWLHGVDEGTVRRGQPVVERLRDEWLFGRRVSCAGERFLVHPVFLLPCHPANEERFETACEELFPHSPWERASAR
jgi:hypothetical protein